MKIIAGLIAIMVIVLLASFARYEVANQEIGGIQAQADKTSERIMQQAREQQERASKQAREQQAAHEYKAWAAEKTKIHVRGRGTKECMKALEIDVINNEVIDCNKDRWVELRNDQVETFKKEQGL